MIRNLVKAVMAVTALTWAMSSDTRASFYVTISDGSNSTSTNNIPSLSTNTTLNLSTYSVHLSATSTDPTSTISPSVTLNILNVQKLTNVENTLTVTLYSDGFTFSDPSVSVQTTLYSNLLSGDSTGITVNGQSMLGTNSTPLLTLYAPVISPQTISNSQTLTSSGVIQNVLTFNSLVYTSPNDNLAMATLTTNFPNYSPPVTATPAPGTLLAMATVLPFLGMAFRRRSSSKLDSVRA